MTVNGADVERVRRGHKCIVIVVTQAEDLVALRKELGRVWRPVKREAT